MIPGLWCDKRVDGGGSPWTGALEQEQGRGECEFKFLWGRQRRDVEEAICYTCLSKEGLRP